MLKPMRWKIRQIVAVNGRPIAISSRQLATTGRQLATTGRQLAADAPRR